MPQRLADEMMKMKVVMLMVMGRYGYYYGEMWKKKG